MMSELDTSSLREVAGRPGRDESERRDLLPLLAVAGPNVATTVIETLQSLVEFAIVSRLGPPAQAAVQTGLMVFFTIFGLLLGTMLCVSTMVSQSLGANRPQDCSAYAWQGVWLSLLYGLLGILLWPVVPVFYALAGHAPDVQLMEIDYTRIRLLALGLTGVCYALGHFFIGIHQPRVNAYSAVISAAISGVLCYGLVLGRWGLPAMGIAGAGVAAAVAAFVRALFLLAWMCSSRRTAEFAALRTLALNLDKMRRLVRVGWPVGATLFLDILAWSVFLVGIIGMFGTVHLAAMSACWRFTELSYMPALGVGMAVSAAVGRAIGQGHPDRARRRARLGAMINLSYMGAMGLVFAVFGRQLMALFSQNEEVIEVGAPLMLVAAAYQLFDALAVTYSGALRGAGDTRWLAAVGITLAWTVMIGGGALAARLWPHAGALGPWILATTFIILLGTALCMRWHAGVWERLDVIGRIEPRWATCEASSTEAPHAAPAARAARDAGPQRIGSPPPCA